MTQQVTEGATIDQRAIQQAGRYIAEWKRSLLDLSRRNRLIDFYRGFATRVQIASPGVRALYAALVVEEKQLAFPYVRGITIEDLDLEETVEPGVRVVPGDLELAPPVATPKDVRDLHRKLERLRRNTRTVYEEQGVHTLFLALGMLEWKEAESAEEKVHSPLLLTPVHLDRSDQRYVLRPHEDGPEVNPTLEYRLQREFGIALPALETNGEAADGGAAIHQFLGKVRESVRPKGWAVLEQAWLAQFAFYKLPMYRDLEAPGVAERAAAHPVVAALCGLRERSELAPVDVRKVEEESARPEVFPVADADSSQLEVMEQARQGRTMVVQGPPGTGKSQTILNLIAQALRDGRKVLFVSEKRAALEVVYARLQRLGLADLCLDLHSSRASRKAVVEELEASLAQLKNWQKRADGDAFEEYRRVRARLNQYVEELHRPRDRQGRSAFQVHGTLARLHEVPFVDAPLPFDRPLEVERDRENAVFELVRQVARLGVWDEERTHPWREAAAPEDFIPIAEAVNSAYGALRRATEGLLGVANAIFEFTGERVETARHLEERLGLLRWLARMPDATIQAAWLMLDEAGRRAMVGFAQSVEEHARRRREGAAYLRGVGVNPGGEPGEEPDIEAGEVRALHSVLEKASKRPWLRRVMAEWKVQRRLARLIGRKLRRSEAVGVVRALFAVQESRAWIDAHAGRIRGELGIEPGTDDWNPEATVRAVEWVTATVQAGGGHLSERLRERLVREAPQVIRRTASSLVEAASRALDEWRSAASAEPVVRCFPEGLGGRSFREVSLDELRENAATWEREAGRLPEWLEHRRLMRKAEEVGLSAFFAACRTKGLPAGRLSDAFRRAYFARWLRAAYGESEVLRSFPGHAWEEIRRRFQELDKQLQEQAVIATFEAVAARLPDPLPASELTVLAREARKKRRHLPLRKLFPVIPKLLLAVKPCLMMSPLSVATYLPRELFRFDLVIFDEASQLPPGDAVGVLLRGEQAVIFGDNKQLPPTDFFRAHAEGEEEEPDAQDYESILDIASVYFPGPMLKWHYRSRDERLIAFSNRYFYGRQLITFPAPGTDGVETGVSFVHVPDGVFGKGGSRTNRVEAERVAQLVLEHCRRTSGLSLGVITMSIEQRDAVEEALRRLLRAHPEVKLPDKEEFFVKNLETVQGDERDVIILSVGYGPSEPGGTPSLNFGPLNRMGGDRRLNVAITRARYRMIVVSSMTPEQLAGVVGQARWDGPKMLAGYLRYAKQGGVNADVSGTGQPESEFEEAVRDALVGRGYEVDCQVGVSGYRMDLAVRDPDVPGRYIVGIECDGATYHSARTARDRDRIRQVALENLGWKILRVWSTEWIRDPARATERLVEAIERVRAGEGRADGHDRRPLVRLQGAPEGSEPVRLGAPPVAASYEEVALAAASDGRAVAANDETSQRDVRRSGDTGGAPSRDDAGGWSGDAARQAGGASDFVVQLLAYRVYRGGRELIRASAVVDEHPDVLAELTRQVVEVEAPVHVEQLYERLRGLYGHSRAGKRIREALSRGVSRAVRRGWVRKQGDFLWRADQEPSGVRPRGPGEAARPPEHICAEEWEAAVLEVLSQLGATERSRAARAVASAVLGYSRISARAREHVMEAIDRLVARGELLDLHGVLHVRQPRR
ncbi:DUF3320 domain-containing protein [Geochorda subterranea]|uniref:DUF3320 domain-containing protein n=1 Tax=Geochorda subterranea TaxID=3109564 RepID=A0ABZ1BMA5_9FIRM|nr:DUF3320 domain-containing protein [Limnochorda sp. LNt]WRP13713.1 DUF3320 domain-containing protein [Limnochorda sp. LNt]